jgi:hypothetical protein
MINHPHDEPILIEKLLDFLYTGNYEPKPDIRTRTAHDAFEIIPTAPYLANDMSYELQYEFPHTCGDDECLEDLCPYHSCRSKSESNPCGSTCFDSKCPTCCRMVDKTPPTESSLHVKMFILTDKYQVTGLMDRATSKFEAACDSHWDNAEQLNKAA